MNAIIHGVINIDYKEHLFQELDKLEHAYDEREAELQAISFFIRNKLWNHPDNTKKLLIVISEINNCFEAAAAIAGKDLIYSLYGLLQYISFLSQYKKGYAKQLDNIPFEEITDKIWIINQKKVIRSQWDDVLSENGGLDTFIRVFDDVFLHAFEKYEDEFFHNLNNEVLTRCVVEKECDESRFIPLTNHNNNRWNPPGKTYLYLSFKNQDVPNTPNGITGGQYICLLECRVSSGSDVCFCDFCSEVSGRLLDLSYNDVPLYVFRKDLVDAGNRIAEESFERLIHNPEAFANIEDPEYLKDLIKRDIDEHSPTRGLVSISMAKQYLKSICSCIYEKVDDSAPLVKERSYRSFHVLAEYLEKKGITGIIYPCTRTEKMVGKNVVLFNIDDAKPVPGSVTHYHYE